MSLKDNSLIFNIKLIVAYEGTRYLGWQKTPFGPSIENSLQETIEKVLQEKVQLQAAGRTDAGVHACGQVVNFFCRKNVENLKSFQISLNGLLPKDIIIVDASHAPLSFHPTLDCISKEYRYSICNTPFQFPEFRHYSWHVFQPLDDALMKEAAALLIGEHDFSSFCNAKKNESYSHHIRRVEEIEMHFIADQRFYIKMRGNHFLYKMARNIAGTLVDVGRGKLTVGDVSRILKGHDRKIAGVTAPAHGLNLFRVFYEAYDGQ